MPSSSDPSVSAPLLAFLRGIERRAFVLLRAQCGAEAPALAALGLAMAEFLAEASPGQVSRWPMQFWTAVLRQPPLCAPHADEPPLDGLAPGARAALLTRWVAGLDGGHAAQALGVAPATFDRVTDRALAGLAARALEADALREALHARFRQLSTGQVEAIAATRDAALAAYQAAARRPDAASRPPSRGGHRTMWVALVLLLLALATSFLWRPGRAPGPGPDQALPAPPAMPGPVQDDASLVTHPDYAQVAAGDDAALIADLAFYSWLAAGAVPAANGGEPAAAHWDEAGTDAAPAAGETEQQP